MTDVLVGRGVTLAFGGIRAVDGVDFGSGGPNPGTDRGPRGKTSLLNCISQVFLSHPAP
jgi:ABC-type branched-subunit amino acid transport system ATPase component